MNVRALGLSRQGNEQWDSDNGRGQHEGIVSDLAALEEFAMVGSQDDNAVIQQAGGFQGIEQAGEFRIPGGQVLIVAQAVVDDLLPGMARTRERMSRLFERDPPIFKERGVLLFGRVRFVRREDVEVGQGGRIKFPDGVRYAIHEIIQQENAAGNRNASGILLEVSLANGGVIGKPGQSGDHSPKEGAARAFAVADDVVLETGKSDLGVVLENRQAGK